MGYILYTKIFIYIYIYYVTKICYFLGGYASFISNRQISDLQGKWEAFLVEANPQFTKELKALEENFPGQVHSQKMKVGVALGIGTA